MMFMQVATVQYAGTFRFRDRPALERALSRARFRIREEHELAALGGGWMRCFVMFDMTLTVNLTLPAETDNRDAAAEVFAELSTEAVEGAVTATINDIPVESYRVAAARRVSANTNF